MSKVNFIVQKTISVKLKGLVRRHKIFEKVSKIKDIHERFQILKKEYKSSLKRDEKLFLWLLSSPEDKLVLFFIYVKEL